MSYDRPVRVSLKLCAGYIPGLIHRADSNGIYSERNSMQCAHLCHWNKRQSLFEQVVPNPKAYHLLICRTCTQSHPTFTQPFLKQLTLSLALKQQKEQAYITTNSQSFGVAQKKGVDAKPLPHHHYHHQQKNP